MQKSYLQVLSKLYGTGSSMKYAHELSPDTISFILNKLGNPQNAYPTIHVAGTNGKGSVCTKLASCLQHSGFKTGLSTSPHLCSFRERMKINELKISEEEVCDLLPGIFDIIDTNELRCSFFERMVALAFSHFEKKNVDWAVIETGLGGRDDATNVITPGLSVITSIGLDHTRILGETIEEITLHKCGIIKENIPVLIGTNVPVDIVKKVAAEKNAPLFIADQMPNYQEENRSMVIKALDILHKFYQVPLVSTEILQFALEAEPPSRMEHRVVLTKNGRHAQCILDVCHNPQAVLQFFRALRSYYPQRKFRVCFSMVGDKDVKSSSEIVGHYASFIHPMKSQTSVRACDLHLLEKTLKQFNKNVSLLEENGNIETTIQQACELSSSEEIIVICGSTTFMNEARKAVGISEPVDKWDLSKMDGIKEI